MKFEFLEKISTFVTWYKIWYVLSVIILMYLEFPNASVFNMGKLLLCIILPLFIFAIIFCVYLPIVGIIHYLIRFVKNTKMQIALAVVAFITLPLLIYMVLNDDTLHTVSTYPNIIEFSLYMYFCWYFPCAYIVQTYFDKTSANYKRNVACFIVGIILLNYVSISGIIFTNNFILYKELNKYNPVIEYIENYKKDHGKYPDKINELKPSAKILKFYEYKTFDDNNKYVFEVGEGQEQHQNKKGQNKTFLINSYQHCSNLGSKYCHFDKNYCDMVHNWNHCSTRFVELNK